MINIAKLFWSRSDYPAREAFGWQEYFSLVGCATYYRLNKIDPPYGGKYQKNFESQFTQSFESESSRLVSTGTSAVYVSLKSLPIPKNSVVLVSSVTDGGCISAIIEAGFKPALVDTGHQTFNINLESVIKTYNEVKSRNVNPPSCLVACHIGGEPIIDIEEISKWCTSKGIFLIEDCSQAIKAQVAGRSVGTFGQLAAFSLMYRKNISSAGSAGIILINDKSYLNDVLAMSDRGKPIWQTDKNLNDPGLNLYSALNHNSNEFIASIALSSLRRIEKTNLKRVNFCLELLEQLKHYKIPIGNNRFNSNWAPFYLTLFKNDGEASNIKLLAEQMNIKHNVPLLINYGCLASKWPWLEKYLVFPQDMPLATKNIENSFNLFLNEKYTSHHAEKIAQVAAISLKNIQSNVV
jgi:dTDP-4-amino-4,6-dideoxygalactose transaminase